MGLLVSGGQLVNLSRGGSRASFAIQLSDQVMQTYAQIYERQPQVHTVVRFFGRNIAHLGIQAFRRISDNNRERVTGHPLTDCLANPFPGVNGFDFRYALASDLAIYDCAYIIKMRSDSGRILLRQVPPAWVKPGDGPWWRPDFYTIRGDKDAITVRADDMIVIHGYHPTDPRAGMSPLESQRQSLVEEYESSRSRTHLFRNGSRISGVIERPKDAKRWEGAQFDRFKASWQQAYGGNGADIGGTPILEDGMTFRQVAFSPVDAQIIESRKLLREEVAAAYGVPAPFVGILDHATFSNITEQHKQLYMDCLGPQLAQIEAALNSQLVPEFPDTEGVYVEFNIAEKLKGSFEEQAAQLQTAVGAAYMTRNEARARMNLPPVDGGDELVTPLNVLLGGQASPTDSAPKAISARVTKAGEPVRHKHRAASIKARVEVDEAGREAELKDFFERQADSVLALMASGADLDDVWDADAWNAELGTLLKGHNVETVTKAAQDTLESVGLDPSLFDAEVADAYIGTASNGVAEGINATTLGQLDGATEADDPNDAYGNVFWLAATVRAGQIVTQQVTAMSGFGTHESLTQAGVADQATKTWIAGSNPRFEHAAVDGETVALRDTFSNGLRWPGDSYGTADQNANCNCDMTVDIPAGEE